jgi:coproporphyrinogen III oxidase-like Fe-S oxidoreductase
MAGNQGETKETLLKSLRFAQEINADTCQFFPLMVYPGTEAYEWAKKKWIPFW